MMIDLLTIKWDKNQKQEISQVYAILKDYLGKGTASTSKPMQINGTCSFQVLTEAFRDIFGSKVLYNTYKLDFLTHIQEEFQEITDAMEPLAAEYDHFKQLYPLHLILLEENQKQIEITKQVLARAKAQA